MAGPLNDDRLRALEARLERLEQRLDAMSSDSTRQHLATISTTEQPSVTPGATPTPPTVSSPARSMDDYPASMRSRIQPSIPETGVKSGSEKALGAAEPLWSRRWDFSPGMLMAWGAALSLLLAAAYFLGLLATSGWLTPPRQLIIAASAGLGLIFAGLGLARFDRAYAAYLPAAGIVVLYLTVYAGQLLHKLIDPLVAMILCSIVSLLAIALGFQFRKVTYSLVAVVGVYLSPMLLQASGPAMTLAVYFLIWALVFCGLSLQSGRREIYLLAVYLGLFSFDAATRFQGQGDWLTSAIFQGIQFLIFALASVAFSVFHRRPMTSAEAVAHAPPLFYFYLLEYALLKTHNAPAVPWVALGSVIVVTGFYLLARLYLDPRTARAGATLASSYASVVVAHIVCFELTPIEWLPWSALVIAILALLGLRQVGLQAFEFWPIWLVSGVLCLAGCGWAVVDGFMGTEATTSKWILPIYAIVLYAIFYKIHGLKANESANGIALYAGHFALMVSAIRILDDQLLISLAWGILGIAMMGLAWRIRSRLLGQSALFIYGVSALKVLLYDLADSRPPVRIGVLLILAASLYLGGWLYRRLAQETVQFHTDSELNRQIKLVVAFSQSGLAPPEIACKLLEMNEVCRAPSGWTSELVAQILNDHAREEQ